MPKILVVDDEADSIKLLQIVLKRHGFETIDASNALDGLRLAQEESPDAIILDLMLPKIDGEEFCTRLRGNAAIAPLPILVLTARSAYEAKERVIAAGADYYMTKPPNFAELVNELHRLIVSP